MSRDTAEAGCQCDIENQPRPIISTTCCRQVVATQTISMAVMSSGSVDTVDDSLAGHSSESGENVGIELQLTGSMEEGNGGSHEDPQGARSVTEIGCARDQAISRRSRSQ